jgi:hypothetical protein
MIEAIAGYALVFLLAFIVAVLIGYLFSSKVA